MIFWVKNNLLFYIFTVSQMSWNIAIFEAYKKQKIWFFQCEIEFYSSHQHQKWLRRRSWKYLFWCSFGEIKYPLFVQNSFHSTTFTNQKQIHVVLMKILNYRIANALLIMLSSSFVRVHILPSLESGTSVWMLYTAPARWTTLDDYTEYQTQQHKHNYHLTTIR